MKGRNSKILASTLCNRQGEAMQKNQLTDLLVNQEQQILLKKLSTSMP